MARAKGFKSVVDEAVDDMLEHGFDSAERVAYWEERLRRAADVEFGAHAMMDDMIRDVLRSTYERMIERGGITKRHPGVGRWTIERVKPELRAELDRRILASANLIKLRRRQRKQETLARFSGWATSLPSGGPAEPDKRKEKARIKKPLASLSFEERRVLTDQGHKLTSALSEITASGGGAIAAVWRSHWRQAGYNYREDHKERDEHVYLIRGSWAHDKGLVKPGADGYVGDITRPAEEPFCRCWHVYVYALRDLEKRAPEMLTKKGREALAEARTKISRAKEPA